MSRWEQTGTARSYRTACGPVWLWREPDGWYARHGGHFVRGAITEVGALYQLALARMAAEDPEAVEVIREALRALSKEEDR